MTGPAQPPQDGLPVPYRAQRGARRALDALRAGDYRVHWRYDEATWSEVLRRERFRAWLAVGDDAVYFTGQLWTLRGDRHRLPVPPGREAEARELVASLSASRTPSATRRT